MPPRNERSRTRSNDKRVTNTADAPPLCSCHQIAQDAGLVIVGERTAAIVAARGIGPVTWKGRAVGHAGERVLVVKLLVAVLRGGPGDHRRVSPDGQCRGLRGAG